MKELTVKENMVLQTIKENRDGEMFYAEDVVSYSDFCETETEELMASLAKKGFIDYKSENKYGLIKEAIVFNADGSETCVAPDNGTDFSIYEMQSIVGGYIELVKLGSGKIMIVNEEGKINQLPMNTKATQICQLHGINEVIVGDVLVCDEILIK